jgi:excisionase family DNA binding protein
VISPQERERRTRQRAASENNRAAYSIAETMALTGLGRDSIYKAIRAGHLPARKLGRRTLILFSDLQTFLETLPTMEAA